MQMVPRGTRLGKNAGRKNNTDISDEVIAEYYKKLLERNRRRRDE